jgi:gliding motility-associated-like protein
MRRLFLRHLTALVGALVASAVSLGQWVPIGSATSTNDDCVQLTTTAPNQVGAAWHDCTLNVSEPFDITFDVNLGNNDGGADGMCFVLHQAGTGAGTFGVSGGSLGYAGGPFNPSLCVEIDTWQNGDVGDPSFDHIGVQSNGQNNHNLGPPIQANPAQANIETGQWHTFRVTWDPVATQLEVYFAGFLRHDLTLDLVGGIFGGNPYVNWGFVASTGGATNTQSFCLTDAGFSSSGPGLSLLVGETLALCGENDVELSAEANPGASLSWEGQVGPTLTVNQTGTYEVVAELDGCVESASVEVVLQEIPVIQFEINNEPVSGSVEVCFGESLGMQVLASAGASASWDLNGSASLNINSSGDYWASASINGCDAEPDYLHVDLLPNPTAEVLATPPTLCWEESGAIQVSLGPGSNVVNWSLPAGTTFLNQAGPGVYQVNLVGNNGCEASETFSYTMLPPIVTGLVDPAPLCDESVATLSVTGNVDNLSWNVGGNSPQLPVVASMGGGPFVANVTLGNCAQSDTAWVTWWPTPSTGTLPEYVTRCVLDPATTFNWPSQTDAAVGSWLWSVNGEPATAGYSLTEEGDYVIEVRDNATGCSDVHNLNVEVWPNLAVDADPVDPLICMGDSTLVRVELLPVLGTDPFEIPFSLVWSTEGASGFENNVAGGEHYVTATNACGTSVALAEVEEEYCGCHVWIPNAFTPDSDGLNEGFRIVSSCEWDAFSFKVFNRWGEQVWSTTDSERPWDGGADDLGGGDHYLPDGWYPYVVSWEYREDGVFYREQKTGRILMVR